MFETASQLDSSEIEEMGIYGQMARYGSDLFDDEDFAHLYDTDNGRPSTPPSMLAKARLLQHYEDISEREVIRRCKYDLRWKVALGLELETTDKPFARTTFQAFRYRLTLHGEEGMVFEKSIERAREAGLIEDDLEVALDTSPVRGRGAVEHTYQQISSQIGAVLRSVAKSVRLDVESLAEDWELARQIEADSIKGCEYIDWDDSEQVDGFLRTWLRRRAGSLSLSMDMGQGNMTSSC
jgi:transposase